LGIIDEFKDRKYYQKPSVKKRLAKKKAIARHKKEQRKRQRSN
jgi:ribosomal protein S21